MLNFWDYMVIALYVVALVVVGWLASKKVKNAKDYISANRGLGIIVMIGSLAGAAIGAGGTIGLAGDVGEKINQACIENGNLRVLGVGRRGARYLLANKPITTPEECKGLKLRLPSIANWVTIWQEIGALPTPIAFSEVYTSLQTGVSPQSISAYMIGEHGASQMAAWSCVNFNGIPLTSLEHEDPKFAFDKPELQKRAIGGGWVTYRGKHCTEYGIATTAARMAHLVLHDEKAIMPASAELCGEYKSEAKRS